MKHQIYKGKNENVAKYVFETDDALHKPAAVEAVLYKYPTFSERTVICCSTQCGCPVGCSFCGTGRFFVRNLGAMEIVEQVVTIMGDIDCDPAEIKKLQIMFMSMGEPFLNYPEVEEAIRILAEYYPGAQLLVSTSAPETMWKHASKFIALSKDLPKVGLQFSVHESTDEARGLLIPSHTSTLRQISALGEFWASQVGRKPFYNYCVHPGNDTVQDADRLVELFKPEVWETTLSVICEKDETMAASIERQLEIIEAFKALLLDRGVSLRVFNPAGQDDIGGGCGQLWYFQEWLKKQEKHV